jgi:hypothetical protein
MTAATRIPTDDLARSLTLARSDNPNLSHIRNRRHNLSIAHGRFERLLDEAIRRA